MQEKLRKLIQQLNLAPHPEGGFYRETYRSDQFAVGLDRNLMTVIYFILTSDNASKFHRIKSDEMWFFHAGSPLIVHTLDETGHHQHVLGMDFQTGEQPQLLVSKHTIFGSTVKLPNAYSLVSCVVAPGFDFHDFELFSEEELLILFPHENEIISRLT
jgi:predicted cupin superfamily sugar epimerase